MIAKAERGDTTTAKGEAAPAGVTPMMAQYLTIKAAHSDCLLFYRMGDFYELFFDDAAIAAQALNITLTRRGRHDGEPIPMAGVPVVSSDDYLQRLIALGHRVAVCEQVEDPAEAKRRGAKSVVKRDVVRLITPGTLTEDALLEPGRANLLVALARLGGTGPKSRLALAWTDLSTGSFSLMETVAERLGADLARLEPAEIVVAQPIFDDPVFSPLFAIHGRAVRPEPQALFDGATAESRVCRFFDVATLDGFGSFSRVELAAAAGLIAYLGKTQLDAAPRLRRPERVGADQTMQIDPATRASLELTRTGAGRREGSLLATIDRTTTGAGGRLLAARLAAPLTEPADIARRQASLAHFLEDRDLRDGVRTALRETPDLERALSRLLLDRGGPRDLAAIRDGLDAAGRLAALLHGDDLPDEVAQARAALVAVPPPLSRELFAALADAVPLMKRDGGFVREGAVADLDTARRLGADSRRVIAEMQGRYAETTGVRSLKIKHNNVLGYFVEVGDAHAPALREAGGFYHRQTMASAMRFSTDELAELESRIAGASAEAIRLELAVFERLAAAVGDAADPLRAAAEALAILDVATALARLAGEAGWARPRVDDSRAFSIEAGRHPVVEAALARTGGSQFVANDCDLTAPDESGSANGHASAIWLLTGPNMGGKSTFLRQNALIAILAQMGSYVPAASAHIGVVDRLFSRVGASDELAEGRSTFMVEMVETAAILNQAGDRALVILDEIGRGTATYDGMAIAFATVEHLHTVNRCRALFATHFHELTALAGRLDRLVNATMRVKEWEGEVVFLHEVTRGVADRSYGIQVARLAGLPQSVVERARHVLQELEKSEQGEKRTAFVDDLPLFSAAASRPVSGSTSPGAAAEPLRGALAKIDPDSLSPRDALEALYRLKALDATCDD